MGKRPLLMTLCVMTALSAAAAPELDIAKHSSPPKIDGVLNDDCWRDAAKIDAFHLIGQDGVEKKHKAYVTCDDSWLYVAFDVAQPLTNRVEPAYVNGLDDYVQRDDCVKVSFDPAGDGKVWYHFKVNRANCRRDQRNLDKTQEVNWNVPWRSAVMNNDQHWVAEIALPLCQLYPLDRLSNAKINLLISCNMAERDPQGVITKAPTKFNYTWAPLSQSFLEPEKLGRLKGLEKLDLAAPFLPFMEKAGVAEYFQKNGKYYYGINVELKPYTGTLGKVDLVVEDITATGEKNRVGETVQIPRNSGPKNVRIDIPASSLVKRTATLSMVDPATGEVLQKMDFRDKQTETLDMVSGYLDRNYYTSEKMALALCAVRLPGEALKTMRFHATGENGAVLGEIAAVSPETRVEIPLSKLAIGAHDIIIRLMEKGDEVSSLRFKLVKREPKAGLEWKIDHVNRVLLNNDKPFFPMGLVVHDLRVNDFETAKSVADAGFNFMMLWQKLDKPERLVDYCDLFEKAGLYTMPAIDDMVCPDYRKPIALTALRKFLSGKDYDQALATCYSMTGLKCALSTNPAFSKLTKGAKNEIFEEFCRKIMPNARKAIEATKNRKAIFSWWIFDEPHPLVFDQWLMGREFHNLINATDGYRPVGVNYASYIPSIKDATNWFDILVTDPYWAPGGPDANRCSPNYVSWIVSETDRRGLERRQPIWTLPMAPFWSGSRKRVISPEEQYCQTYLAVINGASGLLYFALNLIHDQEGFNVLSELAKQFRDRLGAVCVTPAVSQNVIYKTRDAAGAESVMECAPNKQKYVDVQVKLKRDPEGGYVLLAANSRYYPVDVEITLSGLDGTVSRLFSDKTCAVSGGKWADRFERFGVRAYKIDRTLPEPIRLTVTAIPPSVVPPEETSLGFPFNYRPGKKNAFCNPSFEEMTVAGYPDYYFPKSWLGRFSGLAPVWAVDEREAKFGKRCLRLTTKSNAEGEVGMTVWNSAPQNRQAEKYVFSVWLKGDRKGLTAVMRAHGFVETKSHYVTLSDQWTRYEFAGTLPANLSEHNRFDICLSSPGVMWMDGVQLEKGDKATDFEE